jgi:hypothetical protein
VKNAKVCVEKLILPQIFSAKGEGAFVETSGILERPGKGPEQLFYKNISHSMYYVYASKTAPLNDWRKTWRL